jgi:hypothetical protein
MSYSVTIMERKTSQCRNCGAFAPDAYCPSCGQETREHPPTFWEFVHEFVTHYLALEGALWRSLKALLFKPGFLTLEYLAGRKRKYVLPLRLYLTISILFFVALRIGALLAPGELMKTDLKLNLGQNSEITIVDLGFTSVKRNADGTVTCTLPQALCTRITERLSSSPQEMVQRIVQVPGELLANFSSAMFVLLPVFALCLKLLYPKQPYGTHVVFALHQHCLWFLLMLLLMLPWWPALVEALIMAWLVSYGFIALKRVYGSGWLVTILSGLVVGTLYLTALGVVTTTLAIWVFMV